MPEFAGRACGDCRRFVYGLTGEVSTYGDGPDARPMLRAEYGGEDPPCGTCPKHPPGDPEREVGPLDPADDLFAQSWFWDFRAAVRRWKAFDRIPALDPTAEDFAAEVLDADARAAELRLAARLAGAVAAALNR